MSSLTLQRAHPYRFASLGQAVMYLLLSGSVWFRPPAHMHDKVTVFEAVADSAWWAGAFALVGALLAAAAVSFPPLLLARAHTVMIPVLLGYGTANLGTSIHNHTGWQIASMCGALAMGHVHAVVARPAEVE